MEDVERAAAQREAIVQEAISLFQKLAVSSTSSAWKRVVLQSATGAQEGASNSYPLAAIDGGISLAKTGSARTVFRQSGKIEQDKEGASDPSAVAFPTSENGRASDQQMATFQLCGLEKASRIIVHRRSNPHRKGPDVFRATFEVPFEGDSPDLEGFRSALTTPDARSQWDGLVESSELIEMPDPVTRVTKTNFRLGWPASPRDAITVSRTIEDDKTLIDVTTSLRASPDAPAYLRPAPPYVRSHVHISAWCIQLPSSTSTRGRDESIKITAFWSWNLKGAWLGLPTGGLGNQLQLLLRHLVTYVREQSSRIPTLRHFDSGVDVEHLTFDASRDTLAVDYSIVGEDLGGRDAASEPEHGQTGPVIGFGMSAAEGWDVKIKVRAYGPAATSTATTPDWRAVVQRQKGSTRLNLQVHHGKIPSAEDVARASITIQRVAASNDIRVNGDVTQVNLAEPKCPRAAPAGVLDDAASLSGISIASNGTTAADSSQMKPTMSESGRAANVSHAIDSLIRRNYIYFTSLLQEPEAKWKRVSDSRGVTVTQLDSIDPTLVVYRAEATFVGVGVWGLFSTINTPGARQHWDKGLEDSQLLADVNDLSSLWWDRTKAAWPVSARDNVTLQTSYKSTSSVHIFAFSTDDRALFPEIPAVPATTIRTQIDLRGWSVESLSPTTVHVTLLEQSDPKGWTSKSAVPSCMTAAVAGVGDYAIKFGGPPIVTRLLGAKAKSSKYEHDKAEYRFEYEMTQLEGSDDLQDLPHVECELRCDVETWSPNLDLVIDPPPINVSCLRRHRLGQGAGGLWLTIEHASASLEDDAARIIVRKGNMGTQKGLVLVNGASIKVDQDELDDTHMQELFRTKRSRPQRVPLDLTSPAYLATHNTRVRGSPALTPSTDMPPETPSRSATISERAASPAHSVEVAPASTKRSDNDIMTGPLDVLFLLRRIYAERSPDPAVTPAGWTLVSERNGVHVRRKLMQSISLTVFIQRADKVVQGLAAEDLLHAVSSLDMKKRCDERIESIVRLESYGHGAGTYHMKTKPSFPFRGRAFHVAHLTARTAPQEEEDEGSRVISVSKPVAYFYAAASYAESNVEFPSSRLNPTGLPVGKVLIDGWILETLDPYASSTNQIPSTRCTHVTAIDYAGSLPSAVNTSWNAPLPRIVDSFEAVLKKEGVAPFSIKPPPCLLVVGDGTDESADSAWVAHDPGLRKILLRSDFDPVSRRYEALALLRPLPSDVPRAAALSDASTERGLAQSAATLSKPPSLSNSPQLDQALGVHQRTEPSVTRTTSISSLSSAVSEARRAASARRDPRRSDVFFEVEVELKHFPYGYNVDCKAAFVSSGKSSPELNRASTSSEGDAAPSKESVLDLRDELPAGDSIALRTLIYDLPPSALLAATLDPGARLRCHLVRVVLAEEQFSTTEGPSIRERLNNEQALFSFAIDCKPGSQSEFSGIEELSPSGSSTPVEGIFTVLGERVEVVHVNQTSAMLQREDRDSDKVVVLRKTSDGDAPYVPSLLAQPIAANMELKTPPMSHIQPTALKGPSFAQDVKAEPDTPGASTPVLDGHTIGASDEAASSLTRENPVTAATTQIMNILNNYPLTRLSATTTGVTTSMASGTTTHSTSSDGSKAAEGAITATAGGMEPQQQLHSLMEGLQTRTYSISTLILVAMIFFLLGSLVRSLQSPADFVLLPPSTTGLSSPDAIAVELRRFFADVGTGASGVATREMKRLLEIKKIIFGWDLVIALARR
ncbi:hypothetical protein K437DRAFT_85961 [Tilletiaria anomala UBC 951]|uniref:START domain-containing protein n=1 Tax=Tilletiaria anomala (strain ATCC 24038 / CBS 436.72 / UBC 951) TaxID=1037660 RepID=A0A066W3C9_TILAU|nr:uncharacterized protein K437DRAFT_85961 [Tilletiaria anomala UBC 951]KDN48452.1 hypothetical protein K437DRAFT_85961 [Tilletiaria anomala UBC 951]